MTPKEIEQLRLQTQFQIRLVLRQAEIAEPEPQITITLGLGDDVFIRRHTNVIPFSGGRQLPG
jgi:hypothetical protein